MPFQAFHTSIIGSNHIKSSIECQDHSGHLLLKNVCAVVVCDGHGGEKHFRSAIGSIKAVEVTLEALQTFVPSAECYDQLGQLEKSIIQQWNAAVDAHYTNNPFLPDELTTLPDKDQHTVQDNPTTAYGSTLIAAVLCEGGCFGVQIGDGECVLLTDSGELVQPIAEDDRIPFNLTTSLCDSRAFQHFRSFWHEGPVAAVMVSTDGVRNSFASEDFFKGFCESVFASCWDNPSIAQAELEEFLPQLTARGSGDDVSVAVGWKNIFISEHHTTREGEVMSSQQPLQIGDTVHMGKHDWIVLDVQNNRALLITEKILFQRVYHTDCTAIIWAQCDLHRYLNGDFCNMFNSSERSRILQANEAEDHIFLLSVEEAEQYFSMKEKHSSFLRVYPTIDKARQNW